jgi:hypothetical protein
MLQLDAILESLEAIAEEQKVHKEEASMESTVALKDQ